MCHHSASLAKRSERDRAVRVSALQKAPMTAGLSLRAKIAERSMGGRFTDRRRELQQVFFTVHHNIRLSANQPPTDLQTWLGAPRRAASECRRPVRSAAARRSARARQRQDDAMTPARPSDTTPVPSKAARCPCVAAVASLSTEQDDCSFYRARDTLLSERA